MGAYMCSRLYHKKRTQSLGGVNTLVNSKQTAPGEILPPLPRLPTTKRTLRFGPEVAEVFALTRRTCRDVLTASGRLPFLTLASGVTFDSIIHKIQGSRHSDKSILFDINQLFPRAVCQSQGNLPREPKPPYSSQDSLQKIWSFTAVSEWI